jgi:hypothetical protein
MWDLKSKIQDILFDIEENLDQYEFAAELPDLAEAELRYYERERDRLRDHLASVEEVKRAVPPGLYLTDEQFHSFRRRLGLLGSEASVLTPSDLAHEAISVGSFGPGRPKEGGRERENSEASEDLSAAEELETVLDNMRADGRYSANLDFGEPRPGHAEGTVGAHIVELENNLVIVE